MTLKRLVLIEVIVALFVTFIPVPTFAVESDVTSDDVLTSICDEIISYADEKMYNEGYELGYTLGSSNRTKDYEAPKYPDNKEYMRGLDEGYTKGSSELITCDVCGFVYNKTQYKSCPNADEHSNVDLGCGEYGEEFTCDYCGGVGYNGIDGCMAEHYLHYECEECWMEYITERGYLD